MADAPEWWITDSRVGDVTQYFDDNREAATGHRHSRDWPMDKGRMRLLRFGTIRR